MTDLLLDHFFAPILVLSPLLFLSLPALSTGHVSVLWLDLISTLLCWYNFHPLSFPLYRLYLSDP